MKIKVDVVIYFHIRSKLIAWYMYNIFLVITDRVKQILNKADNSAIGAELTSQRSNLTFEVKGNHDKKLLI